MNEFLWLITLILSFLSIIFCFKYLGKNGLFLWIVVATIVSNIQTVKTINLFGLETSLGTILYGSTFLATDILNYKYGLKESRKTIIYGFLAMIIMTIFMVICLLYKPSINDFELAGNQTGYDLGLVDTANENWQSVNGPFGCVDTFDLSGKEGGNMQVYASPNNISIATNGIPIY